MGLFIETNRYKEGHFKPRQALDDIDEAIAIRDTSIARAIRAVTELGIAGQEGDLPLYERALADLQRVKTRLSDNKFVLWCSLGAHLHAADMYKERGQSDNEKAALKEAGQDAPKLEGVPALSYVLARVGYFERVGDTKNALKELDQASLRPETSDLVNQYALALYELGQDAEALSVLKARLKPDNLAGSRLHIILFAEQRELTPDEACDLYRKRMASLKDERKSGGLECFFFLLFGKKKEAAESIPAQWPLKKYLTESQHEAEFLQSLGKNVPSLILAQFTVALVRLSDGDRKGAKVYFQKVLDTRFYGHILYPYARAYLARMERDPEWPKWIPVKK
jgi:hypothetical protein